MACYCGSLPCTACPGCTPANDSTGCSCKPEVATCKCSPDKVLQTICNENLWTPNIQSSGTGICILDTKPICKIENFCAVSISPPMVSILCGGTYPGCNPTPDPCSWKQWAKTNPNIWEDTGAPCGGDD